MILHHPVRDGILVELKDKIIVPSRTGRKTSGNDKNPACHHILKNLLRCSAPQIDFSNFG
jgi:hypothetical protein